MRRRFLRQMTNIEANDDFPLVRRIDASPMSAEYPRHLDDGRFRRSLGAAPSDVPFDDKALFPTAHYLAQPAFNALNKLG